MNAFRSRQVGRVLGDRRLIADAVVSRRLGGARPGGGELQHRWPIMLPSARRHTVLYLTARSSRSTHTLWHLAPRPCTLVEIAHSSSTPGKARRVNWLPLSLLKIYGSPWRANASCTASMRNSLSTARVSVQPADPPRPHPTTSGAKDRLAHSTTRRRLPTKPSPHADANEGID